MSFQEVVLLAVVVAFAVNLGAHYTGATMGMPYSSRSVALWPALTIVAVFSLLGATLASGKVEQTVGEHLVSQRHVTVGLAIVIVASGALLTTAFNYRQLPTSTIQILVFCVIGAAVAAGLTIDWTTLLKLAVVWVLAPVVAALLGFFLTRVIDRVVPPDAADRQARRQLELSPGDARTARRGPRAWFPGAALEVPVELQRQAAAERPRHPRLAVRAIQLLPLGLIGVGVCASFVMGSNDVANATGVLVLVHLFTTHAAGAIGGAGLFVGALTWGRRILDRVAFDVVKLDLAMASSAQGVQALVVILAVSQGFFTSMNQALIAAMAGTGLARGRHTVDRRQLTGIVRGWAIAPVGGFALAYVAQKVFG